MKHKPANKLNLRYRRLSSVGCWLDTKTGYIFPIHINNYSAKKTLDIAQDTDMIVHITDCSDEWFEYLSLRDSSILDLYNFTK